MQASAAVYILELWGSVLSLKQNLGAYSNAMLFINNKKKDLGLKEDEPWTDELAKKAIEKQILSKEQRDTVDMVTNTIRSLAIQVHIGFCGLEEKFSEIKKEKPMLDKTIQYIETTPWPKYEEVKAFCIITHRLFSSGTLSEIIEKNKEYYKLASGLNE